MLLLDYSPLFAAAGAAAAGVGGGRARYVCGRCLSDLWDDEDCQACARAAQRRADDLVLMAMGVL